MRLCSVPFFKDSEISFLWAIAESEKEIAGPNERAGFIDAPVIGPPARISITIIIPIAKPCQPAVAFLFTVVLKITRTKKKVKMISTIKTVKSDIPAPGRVEPKLFDIILLGRISA